MLRTLKISISVASDFSKGPLGKRGRGGAHYVGQSDGPGLAMGQAVDGRLDALLKR